MEASNSKSRDEIKVELMEMVNDRVGDVFDIPGPIDEPSDSLYRDPQPRIEKLSTLLDRLDSYSRHDGVEFSPDIQVSQNNLDNYDRISEELTRAEFEAENGFNFKVDLNDDKGIAIVSLTKGDKELASIELPIEFDSARLQIEPYYDPDDMPRWPQPYVPRYLEVETMLLNGYDVELDDNTNSDGIRKLLESISDRSFISVDDEAVVIIEDDSISTKDKVLTSTFMKDLEGDAEALKAIAVDVDRLSQPELKPELEHSRPSLDLSL